MDDLRHVVSFVHNRLDCRVASIVGHSKGSIAAMRYVRMEDLKARKLDKHISIPCAINLAGRFMVPGPQNEMITDEENYLSPTKHGTLRNSERMKTAQDLE